MKRLDFDLCIFVGLHVVALEKSDESPKLGPHFFQCGVKGLLFAFEARFKVHTVWPGGRLFSSVLIPVTDYELWKSRALESTCR